MFIYCIYKSDNSTDATRYRTRHLFLFFVKNIYHFLNTCYIETYLNEICVLRHVPLFVRCVVSEKFDIVPLVRFESQAK
jgi:hypothetical protein